MTSTQAEVPFIAAMERKPESPQEIRVTVDPREIYRGDGMMWDLLRKIRRALGMVPEDDRGPKDYATSEFERGMKAGARYGGYHEAPNNNNLKAVIIGCTITLLSAFVLGAWKLSNDSAALRAEFNEWKQSTTKWMDKTDDRMRMLENRRP